jgi:hypothetical protein
MAAPSVSGGRVTIDGAGRPNRRRVRATLASTSIVSGPATDVPETQWTLDVAGGSYARGQGEVDVVLRGPAWSLDRWLWRRGSAETGAVIALADVAAFGDLQAAEEWRRSI